MANNNGSEDNHELVRELLDDNESKTSNSNPSNQEAINKLISTVYSGPTIHDIESALSETTCRLDAAEHQHYSQYPRVSERGLGKIEHKYTLKIKNSSGVMVDDGYKWRKYGQKSIRNSPNPRSYYRCTNPRCNAKKQVERSSEEPDTLLVTYEGLHLHFAYPYLLLSKPKQVHPPQIKKPKNNGTREKAQNEAHKGPTINFYEEEVGPGPQGLLEDMVPLMIRNPSNYNYNIP